MKTILPGPAALLAAGALFAPQAFAIEQTLQTQTGDFRVETVAEGLAHPWVIEFLPD